MLRTIDLVILWLGAYRFWWLVAKDSLTEKWRTRLLGYEDDGKRNRWPNPHQRIGEFVHCPWCLGFWISLAAVVTYYQWPHATFWILAPFAISTLVGFSFAVFERVARK